MPVKRATKSTPKVKEGETYSCTVCGLRVVVDEICGCTSVHPIICCEKKMKKGAVKKTAAKKPAKKAAAKKPAKKTAARKPAAKKTVKKTAKKK